MFHCEGGRRLSGKESPLFYPQNTLVNQLVRDRGKNDQRLNGVNSSFVIDREIDKHGVIGTKSGKKGNKKKDFDSEIWLR